MVKIQLKIPNKNKYYPVRAGNSLSDLKKWITYAKRNYPKQKFIIVDYYKQRMKDKKNREYWKSRYNSPLGLESKYMVYGTY